MCLIFCESNNLSSPKYEFRLIISFQFLSLLCCLLNWACVHVSRRSTTERQSHHLSVYMAHTCAGWASLVWKSPMLQNADCWHLWLQLWEQVWSESVSNHPRAADKARAMRLRFHPQISHVARTVFRVLLVSIRQGSFSLCLLPIWEIEKLLDIEGFPWAESWSR